MCVAQYCRPTAPSWAAQWACGSSQMESTNIPNCYPQVTRAVALIVLNAGTARLKHLPDFSTSIADLVKLKLLHWERAKGRPRCTRSLLRSHPPHPRVILAPICLHVLYCRLKTRSPGNQASTVSQRETVHSGAHPFDTWVTGPVVDYETRLNKSEAVGHDELAIQLSASTRRAMTQVVDVEG